MIMEHSITRTEQVSSALKSFLQQFRSMLAKPGTTSYDHDGSPSDWSAFLGEALEQTAPSSQEARERRAAIVQILQSADVSAKKSIADLLLFADNLKEAHDAIMMCDQQREAA